MVIIQAAPTDPRDHFRKCWMAFHLVSAPDPSILPKIMMSPNFEYFVDEIVATIGPAAFLNTRWRIEFLSYFNTVPVEVLQQDVNINGSVPVVGEVEFDGRTIYDHYAAGHPVHPIDTPS